MASWDVFHADRLELERGLSAEAIRSALARGELRDDDLVRPAGTTVPWARIADIPELIGPGARTGSGPWTDRAPVPLPRLPGPRIDSRTSRRSSPASKRSSRSPRNTLPPSCPRSSSSDVTFPVLKEPEPRPASRSGYARASGVIARMGLGR